MNLYGATIEKFTPAPYDAPYIRYPAYRVTKRWTQEREDGTYFCIHGQLVQGREVEQKDLLFLKNYEPPDERYWKAT